MNTTPSPLTGTADDPRVERLPAWARDLIRRQARGAHVGDESAVLDLEPGTGPADALDALEARTGSRAWRIAAIRGTWATYTRA